MYTNKLDNIDLISTLSECSQILYLTKGTDRLNIINRARAILKENMGNTPFQMGMDKVKLQYQSGYFSKYKSHSRPTNLCTQN